MQILLSVRPLACLLFQKGKMTTWSRHLMNKMLDWDLHPVSKVFKLTYALVLSLLQLISWNKKADAIFTSVHLQGAHPALTFFSLGRNQIHSPVLCSLLVTGVETTGRQETELVYYENRKANNRQQYLFALRVPCSWAYAGFVVCKVWGMHITLLTTCHLCSLHFCLEKNQQNTGF